MLTLVYKLADMFLGNGLHMLEYKSGLGLPASPAIL